MKNSHQRRADKRRKALDALARARNAPMVSTEGRVRAVWSKTMPPRAHIPFHGKSEPKRSGQAMFSGRPTRGDWEQPPTLTAGVSDPLSRRAPRSDD